MKVGVAAMMVAAARAVEMNLRGDVIVTSVADEEVYSIGTSAVLNSGLRADAAIVTELNSQNMPSLASPTNPIDKSAPLDS